MGRKWKRSRKENLWLLDVTARSDQTADGGCSQSTQLLGHNLLTLEHREVCVCKLETGSHVGTACTSVSHPVTRLAQCVPLWLRLCGGFMRICLYCEGNSTCINLKLFSSRLLHFRQILAVFPVTFNCPSKTGCMSTCACVCVSVCQAWANSWACSVMRPDSVSATEPQTCLLHWRYMG